MRVTSLGSGSSGNAYLIEAGPQGRTRLLVDAGFSARVLAERLRLASCLPGQIQGVLVTHEHSDHILGIPWLTKRHSVPVFADPRTLKELRTIFSGSELRTESGALITLEQVSESTEGETGKSEENASVRTLVQTSSEDLWRPFPVGARQMIGDIEVSSFAVSHDAVAPCGYVLSAGGCRVCIVTDTGEVMPTMLESIAQAELLILEANHDRSRLLSGPYPYHLKQRILSSTGHLSNDQAAEAVLRTWRGDGLRWLWLAHLSRTNNTRKLALSSMQKNLQEAGASLSQIHISVLGQEMSQSWDSTRLWHDPHLWETQR
jgi:phosphoribosyl 1,2-cyclic phosphodiesterase